LTSRTPQSLSSIFLVHIKSIRSDITSAGGALPFLGDFMQSENSSPHTTALFPLGRVLATPSAIRLLADYSIQPLQLLQRHCTGDWGKLDEHDVHQNRFALRAGLRIFSSYQLGDSHKIWIITEADRSSTTILLPEEY
jgi:hypothetical protein